MCFLEGHVCPRSGYKYASPRRTLPHRLFVTLTALLVHDFLLPFGGSLWMHT